MEGDKVEIVVVEEGRHVTVSGFVAVDELICEVFDYSWMLVDDIPSAASNLNIPIVDIH